MQFLRDIMVKADIVVTRNISLIYLNFTDKISSIFQVMNLNQSIAEKSKDEYELQVIADSAWLNEPARTYPVSIDPTIMNYAEDYIDTYELRKEPRALTKNTYNISTKYRGDNSYFSKVWIQFFLDDVIPKNAIIRSAVLHMRKTDRYETGTHLSDLVIRMARSQKR